MQEELLSVVEKAFDVFIKNYDNGNVVKKSIPILYFGDYRTYFASMTKVITVGLNPSKIEFPEEDAFLRFEGGEKIKDAILQNQKPVDDYLMTLNKYFSYSPYKLWFNSYEPILNGMDCSYYARKANTALHTDIMTPIATDPTWSRLNDNDKNLFEAEGIGLWHELVSCLKPDIILISMAENIFKKSNLNLIKNGRTTIQLKGIILFMLKRQ